MEDNDRRSIFRQLVKLCPPFFKKYLEENPDPRPQLPCSPADEINPDNFVAPAAAPIVPQTGRLTPEPLTFGNAELELSCTAPGIGSVTIAAGTFVEVFHFTSIPQIPIDRLTFIAGLEQEELDEFLDINEIDISRIKELTRVDTATAQLILDGLTERRLSVEASAAAAAAASLVCVYENTEQTETCPSGALATDPATGAVNPAVVAAGTFTSTGSQAEANALAADFAENLLVCLYANNEAVANCNDTFDSDFPNQSGFAESIPVDVEPEGASSELRVGSFTVPSGAVIVTTNQANADETALNLARSNLNCFYLNAETTKACTDLNPPKTGAVVEAVDDLAAPGNPVTVRAGVFTSREKQTGQEEADTDAASYALSLLRCVWNSAETPVTCPSVEVRENLVINPDEEKSPVFSFTAPAGFYVSSISQQDADNQAEILARGQLDCVYCNPEIAPLCVPDSAYVPGVTELPLPADSIEPWWSRDATRGTPAGAFCDSDALTVLLLAEAANVPMDIPTAAEQCVYESDEISAACVADSSIGLLGSFTASPDNESGRNALRAALSRNSFPDPLAENPAGRVVTWAKGRVSVAEGDIPESFEFEGPDEERGKAYANHMAQIGILQELDCFFENDERRYLCDGDVLRGSYNPQPMAPVQIQEQVEVFVFRSALPGMQDFNGYYRYDDDGLWTNNRKWFKQVSNQTRFYNTMADAIADVNAQLVSSNVMGLAVGGESTVAQYSTPNGAIATAKPRIGRILCE